MKKTSWFRTPHLADRVPAHVFFVCYSILAGKWFFNLGTMRWCLRRSTVWSDVFCLGFMFDTSCMAWGTTHWPEASFLVWAWKSEASCLSVWGEEEGNSTGSGASCEHVANHGMGRGPCTPSGQVRALCKES